MALAFPLVAKAARPGIIAAGACMLALLLFLLLALSRKIRALNQAENERKNFNELREAFINAESSLVYLKDEHLNYVFVNKAFTDFLQLSYQEIIGHNDFELLDTEFARICTKTDLDARERHSLIVSTASWNKRYYRMTKFPVRMTGGSFGVGGYLCDITEEDERRRNRERMIKRNNLLLELLNRSFASKQEQLDYALQELLELSGSRYGYIYFYDEEKGEFTLNSWTEGVRQECRVKGKPKKYKLEETGIWGEVVRQRRPIIINDFAKDNPLKKGYPEGHVELARFMSIPVLIEDNIVAVVGFGNKKTDYHEADVYEMTLLMSGVWNAVQRRDSMAKLVYERNKYFQTLLSIGDGVMVIDCDRKIEMINTVACNLTGWSQPEAAGAFYKEVFVLSHEQEGFTIDDPIEKVFSTGRVQELGNHAVLTAKDGSRYYLEDSAAPILNDKGILTGVVLVFRDVTDKKEQRKKIEYMSFHDSLTGLYNRRFFEEEMNRIDSQRNQPISILMGDVNSLKLTNDIFGHAFGDMLLEKVAEVMRNVCRADDIIARWGGDEFVVLLPKTGPEEAERIAARIKNEVARQQIGAVRGSISVGWDTKTKNSEEIMRVLGNAEAKMYAAKTLERGEVKSRELDTIISGLFEKSDWEKNHALRVSSLCREFGKALGLSEFDVHRLMEAGRLHDIGKVVLNPQMLKKGYNISQTEQKEMSKHPVVGYRILNSFDDTLELAEAVLSHHEKWDGSGYPKGLVGEKIPLLARIIAVVETYDRIMYASANTGEKKTSEALGEIRSCAGTKLDPRLVAAFVEMLERGDNSDSENT
ncbi:MAG: diguanylate cyclase [Peptococcaceae bacterium]|nr:diguanylate cyclase [Peptococcaceae bacterium]